MSDSKLPFIGFGITVLAGGFLLAATIVYFGTPHRAAQPAPSDAAPVSTPVKTRAVAMAAATASPAATPTPPAIGEPPAMDVELTAQSARGGPADPRPAPGHRQPRQRVAVQNNRTYQPPQINGPVDAEVARLALSFVGADPAAEKIWVAAINDPARPANERKNLIEDLNEDGLNYRNLSPADLPMIINRMALIEQLAPSAMDTINQNAFAEAYKDLTNMYGEVAGN